MRPPSLGVTEWLKGCLFGPFKSTDSRAPIPPAGIRGTLFKHRRFTTQIRYSCMGRPTPGVEQRGNLYPQADGGPQSVISGASSRGFGFAVGCGGSVCPFHSASAHCVWPWSRGSFVCSFVWIIALVLVLVVCAPRRWFRLSF